MKKVNVAALLSFNGGFLDTVGFLGLQGLFTAHVGSADGAKNAYLADFTRRESIIFGGIFRTGRRARAFP
jgi:hypothetical protein